MKIKRFFAKDMRTALKEVKDELGVDAVINSIRRRERPAASSVVIWLSRVLIRLPF